MAFSKHVKTIQFDRTRRAYCFFTNRNTIPQDIITEFTLQLPKGIIFISGGATKFPPDTIKNTVRLIEFAIAPLVYEHNLLIVDGGTDAGVMQITGEVLRKVKYSNIPIGDQSSDFVEELPLMGFVPESRVKYPGARPSPQREASVDPNHTYLVMVGGAQEWGDETETIFMVLDYLAENVEHLPIIHIISNGGRITIKEAYYAVRQGYHIIVLEGSARATEVIAAALYGASKADLVTLLKHHRIATQVHEVEETLSWLETIAEYDKITHFNFRSEHPEYLKEIILSRLNFYDT
jgi:hypothetical protein